MIILPCQTYDPYLFERLILPPYYLFDNAPTIAIIATSTTTTAEMPLVETDESCCCWKRSQAPASSSPSSSPPSSEEETICTMEDATTTCSASVASSSTSSISSSTSSSCPQTHGKVRFLQDGHGNMIVHEVVRPEAPYSNEYEKAELATFWYRSKEFKLFRHHGKQLATIAAASPYGEDLRQAWRLCWKKTTPTNKKQHPKNSIQQQYSKLANSAARGLEALVEPALRHDRRRTIQRVLQAQTKLRRGHRSAEERADILRATSVLSSKPTQLLAVVLATGDARVARSIHHSAV